MIAGLPYDAEVEWVHAEGGAYFSGNVSGAIPVRFTNDQNQSEGAMYDRVSRKLFRNAGTGAFTIGPDVATPVMGLHFMKQMPKYTAKSYVQDGLVAMWDGIENSGWLTHDLNATTWKDLVRGVDLVCSQYASFTDNSLTCSSFPGGETLAYSEEFVNSVQQVEVCARFVPSGGWVRNFLVLVKNGVQDYCGIGTYNNTVRTDFHEDGTVRESWAAPFGQNYFSSKQSCSYSRGAHLSSAHGEYNDSYYVTGDLPSTNLPTEDYGIFVGRPGGNAPALIDVNCVRLYSRMLTAAELAHNYAVDKERFNLP